MGKGRQISKHSWSKWSVTTLHPTQGLLYPLDSRLERSNLPRHQIPRDYLRRIISYTHTATLQFTRLIFTHVLQFLEPCSCATFSCSLPVYMNGSSCTVQSSVSPPVMLRQLNSTAFFLHFNNSSPCTPQIAVRSCSPLSYQLIS
jgi:hypothetical protein